MRKTINNESIDSVLKYGLHGVFILFMLLSNMLMLKFYVQSMSENGAAKATVYNFAVNYLASVIYYL